MGLRSGEHRGRDSDIECAQRERRGAGELSTRPSHWRSLSDDVYILEYRRRYLQLALPVKNKLRELRAARLGRKAISATGWGSRVRPSMRSRPRNTILA